MPQCCSNSHCCAVLWLCRPRVLGALWCERLIKCSEIVLYWYKNIFTVIFETHTKIVQQLIVCIASRRNWMDYKETKMGFLIRFTFFYLVLAVYTAGLTVITNAVSFSKTSRMTVSYIFTMFLYIICVYRKVNPFFVRLFWRSLYSTFLHTKTKVKISPGKSQISQYSLGPCSHLHSTSYILINPLFFQELNSKTRNPTYFRFQKAKRYALKKKAIETLSVAHSQSL